MKKLKEANQNTEGCSFRGDTFVATPNDIIKIAGQPTYTNTKANEKTHYEWGLENSHKEVFTIYDWNYGRLIDPNEKITWNIGAKDYEASDIALQDINYLLKKNK